MTTRQPVIYRQGIIKFLSWVTKKKYERRSNTCFSTLLCVHLHISSSRVVVDVNRHALFGRQLMARSGTSGAEEDLINKTRVGTDAVNSVSRSKRWAFLRQMENSWGE